MLVVGPKFIKLDGKQVPIGGWTIVILLLIGAVVTRMYIKYDNSLENIINPAI